MMEHKENQKELFRKKNEMRWIHHNNSSTLNTKLNTENRIKQKK